MSIAARLTQARPLVEAQLGGPLDVGYAVFFSASDGRERACVVHAVAPDLDTAWREGVVRLQRQLARRKLAVEWLRIDWVTAVETTTWAALHQRLAATRRNYFRYGIAFDAGLETAFLEQELNANAMLYGGVDVAHAQVNQKNFALYAAARFGASRTLDFSPSLPAYVLSTRGVFCDAGGEYLLGGAGLNAGRRELPMLSTADVKALVTSGSDYLARQVKKGGQFHYGWFPCFDRPINTYNALRHASSVYAMLEAWELAPSPALKDAIDRALHYLVTNLIRTLPLPDGKLAAFLVDTGDEIKLGGNAVCLLALVKHAELTGESGYLVLLEQLALGIRYMQDAASGRFVHVLGFPGLEVRHDFRIIYYDGEAAFGLLRLYALTKDARWLEMVVKAFDHFIAAKHWQAHDHWLAYSVNELTRYLPEERYYRFGLRNIEGYLDFVLKRETVYPTLLELMMAAADMIERLAAAPALGHLLDDVDLDMFYRALEYRAHYLLNGHFWPELAMYFKNPARIVGSFFIRHHAFRIRIDDVEHYLSGLVAYWKYRRRCDRAALPAPEHERRHDRPSCQGIAVWGGDVNIGRRQHYRSAQLGMANALAGIPALKDADLRIVNLECVVATTGEQGVDKGEGGPYYFRARPEMLRVLAAAHIDIVATANNHSGDYGPDALLEQARWLDAVGIGRAGSGPTLEAALTPAIRRAGALNVALFSLDATQHRFAATADRPGTAYLPLADADAWFALLAPRIEAARRQAHVVLVAVHWGLNQEVVPDPKKIAVGHALIDAGADAVLGASAHVLQGIEIYRERPIIYDAGDMLFDSLQAAPRDGGVFRMELSPYGVERVVFVPIGVGFAASAQRTGEEAMQTSRRFAEQCAALGTQLVLTAHGEGVIELAPPHRPIPSCAAAGKTRYRLEALDKVDTAVGQAWRCDHVPADARIDPIPLGPLKLVGVRVAPGKITSRRMLWVETFWVADAEVDEDIRLDIRAVPVRPTSMPAWGRGMDHDPCDWMLPTRRWVAGEIYRDRYGLRPPPLGELRNVELQMEVGLISSRHAVTPVKVGGVVTLAIPGRDDVATADNSRQYRTDFPELIRECSPGQTWTAEQLQAVTGGKWLVQPPEGWFVRSVVRGSSHIPLVNGPVLYVASDYVNLGLHEQYADMQPVYANNWDSHRKIPALLPSLAGAIVARPVTGLPPDFPLLCVDDPIKALIEIGAANRARFGGQVVAITGSAGKTSTMEMFKTVFSPVHPMHATYDNYNSRVGMLAVLASLPTDARMAVLEVAVSAINAPMFRNIKLVGPDIAVITNIGACHLRPGETTLDVARRKSNVFRGMKPGGRAIINSDSEHFAYLVERAKAAALDVISYGTQAGSDVLLREYDPECANVVANVFDTEFAYHLSVPGRHMAINSLACLAVAKVMGIELELLREGFKKTAAQQGRGRRLDLVPFGRRIRVYDDSYNANPISMRAALEMNAGIRVDDGRKLLVLGDMLELGDEAQSFHRQLIPDILRCAAHQVFLVGDHMAGLRPSLASLGVTCSAYRDVASLQPVLAEIIADGDVILVKASNGVGLHRLVAWLASL